MGMKLIGKNIERAREARGMNQSELARALDVTPQAVQKWEAGGTPRNARLSDIAAVLRVSVADLLGEEKEDKQAVGASISVPILHSKASAGVGLDAQEDVVAGAMRLTDQFIAEVARNTRPDRLRIIHAHGDSMSPTLESGDLLLVDTGVITVNVDGIYVLRAHDRLFVKRVRQRLDGQYEISSDNPAHRNAEILNGEHQVEVVGRVIWYWNGRRVY